MFRVYSIRDDAAGEFGPLFEAKNDAVAIRQFKALMGKADFPEEYSLHLVGMFNRETGSLVDNHDFGDPLMSGSDVPQEATL